MRALALILCALLAARARAADAPSATALASARGQDRLDDGTELSFSLQGDLERALKGFSVSAKPASEGRVPHSVILIVVPASGGGQSVAFPLVPAAAAGQSSSWDLTAPLQAAIKAGKLDATLEAGSQVMVQFLRVDKKKKRKGDAVAPPLTGDWVGGSAPAETPKAAEAPAKQAEQVQEDMDLGPPAPAKPEPPETKPEAPAAAPAKPAAEAKPDAAPAPAPAAKPKAATKSPPSSDAPAETMGGTFTP